MSDTHYKGPGQWRTQARELESDDDETEVEDKHQGRRADTPVLE